MMTDLDQFYKDDAYHGFGGDFHVSEFEEYAEFVKAAIGDSPVLELGSGAGAAAYALHLKKIQVTASDIFTGTIRRNFSERKLEIPIQELNIESNPLPSSSVFNYSMYAVIEHLRDPLVCLKECYRTLQPQGKLVIVSPNLLSPLTSLLTVFNCLKGKWKAPWFTRKDGYTYPFGDTFIDALYVFIRNCFIALQLRVFPSSRRPRFRKPCLKKPAMSDSDAIYLCEPLGLRLLLEQVGFEVVSFQEPRRSGSWAGSVWIVALKK